MGCHTWFGNDKKYITRRELRLMRDEAIAYYQKNVSTYEDYCALCGRLAKAYYPEYEYEMKTYGSSALEPIMRDWKNPTRQKWRKEEMQKRKILTALTRKKLSRHRLISLIKKSGVVLWHDSNLYDLSKMGWCDQFRYHDYDQPDLCSMEDVDNLLAAAEKKFFIDRNTDGTQEEVRKQVREICARFFAQYPHGKIVFG